MSDANAVFTGKIPEAYDRFLGPVLFAPYADDLVRRVAAVLRRGDVLETACGTGILTRRLDALLPKTIGIIATDLNEAMFSPAHRAMPESGRVTWRQADAGALPFPDGSFGAIACQFGMMFVPDKGAAVSEARRVLDAGGLFAFNVWGSFSENPFGRIAHETIGGFFAANPPTFYQVPFGFPDPRMWQDLLEAHRFAGITAERVTFEAQAPSARSFALGLVRGNPVSHAIQDAELAFEPIVEAVAQALAREGGDTPYRSTMSALVVTARAAA